MDIRELKYFAQIAKDGNFSTAAAKLSISQPALSKVIQKMEDQLGVSLFYTFQRRQKLTDALPSHMSDELAHWQIFWIF